MFAGFDLTLFPLIAAIALSAGFVKGVVGFGLPMILIAGLSTFLPIEQALGILILPTLIGNGAQALRQGWAAAQATMIEFRRFLIVGGIFLAIGAQLIAWLPAQVLFLIIGVPVTSFALIMLSGLKLHIAPGSKHLWETGISMVAGTVGGVSGVWGPPTVLYLTAIGTEKRDSIRAQGVIYGLGALMLMFLHGRTGVVNSTTFSISVLTLMPMGVGMWLGFKVQDRLNQELFRSATLALLVIAGLNLVRRGLF